MKWASVLTKSADLSGALSECKEFLQEKWDSRDSINLVAVFVSPHFATDYQLLPVELRKMFPTATLFGCSGAGVIGDGRELEGAPGISLTVASMPGVDIQPFHITRNDLPTPDAPPDAWIQRLAIDPAQAPQFLLLLDPFSMPVEEFLSGLDYAYPHNVKVGGLASGGSSPIGQALFLNDQMYSEGGIGVALTGDILVDTVVAQGCRPIGEPMRVTGAERNILVAVDGEPPLRVLQRLYKSLPRRDQEVIQNNLLLGIAMDHMQEESGAGEFLVRNLIGVDNQRGILAVGSLLNEGQIVQFHIRDAVTSSEDLRHCLQEFTAHSAEARPEAALLFSCTGRGVNLYGEPNHDTGMFMSTVGNVPLGGFFCGGEIGPVGGITHLHGFTSSFAIFRRRTNLS